MGMLCKSIRHNDPIHWLDNIRCSSLQFRRVIASTSAEDSLHMFTCSSLYANTVSSGIRPSASASFTILARQAKLGCACDFSGNLDQ